MKQKKTAVLIFVFFLVFLLMACTPNQTVKNEQAPKAAALQADEAQQHPDVDFSVSCMECHQSETPEIVSDWKSSAHGKMNFGCYMCHGDGVENFSVSPGSERCIACHSGNEKCFTRVKESGSCFSCHDGHTLKLEKKK